MPKSGSRAGIIVHDRRTNGVARGGTAGNRTRTLVWPARASVSESGTMEGALALGAPAAKGHHFLQEVPMMMRLIVRLLINAAALAVAAWAVPGIDYVGWGALLLMALIFGIVNALIRPIVMVLSCPLLIVTLGLFTFIVNACMLLLAGSFAKMFGVAFIVNGFPAAFLGAIIISIVSIIL